MPPLHDALAHLMYSLLGFVYGLFFREIIETLRANHHGDERKQN